MGIVIDSCSLILLAKATVLSKVSENYKLIVTHEVYEEVMKGKKEMFKDALLVEKLAIEKKINLVKTNSALMNKLAKDFNMGFGEASTIAVAIKQKHIVATDNRQGRKAVEINSMHLVGSLEIIVSLFRKNKIDKEKAISAIIILKEEGWFSGYLIEKALEDLKNE